MRFVFKELINGFIQRLGKYVRINLLNGPYLLCYPSKLWRYASPSLKFTLSKNTTSGSCRTLRNNLTIRIILSVKK